MTVSCYNDGVPSKRDRQPDAGRFQLDFRVQTLSKLLAASDFVKLFVRYRYNTTISITFNVLDAMNRAGIDSICTHSA